MVLSWIERRKTKGKLDFLINNYAGDIINLSSEDCELDSMMKQIVLSRTYLQNYVNYLQFEGTDDERLFGMVGSYRFEKLDESLMILMRYVYGIEIYLYEENISYETVSS